MMNNETLQFKVFCMVMYQKEKDMLGKDVAKLFSENDVFPLLTECHETLCAQGVDGIIMDIDEYIAIGQKPKAETN